MAQDNAVTLYTSTTKNPFSIKVAMAQILRGGAIVEVSTLHQAKIAESSGAISVLITPKPSPISRMPDPSLIKSIKQSLSIPVMAKTRVGHFVEAQILESIPVDYIDESETLSVSDDTHFINKHNFRSTFVSGCRSLGEALNRVREGAALVRISGGEFVETVRNVRRVMGEVRVLGGMGGDEVYEFAKRVGADYDVVAQTKQMGRLPVVSFACGGIWSPADVGLVMQLGCDGVVLGLEVFDGVEDPGRRIRAIVRAVRCYNDPVELGRVSFGLESGGVEEGMAGLDIGEEEEVENEVENRVERFEDVGGSY